MSEGERRHEIVQQWVQKAENGLRTAEHTLTLQEDCPFDTVCFHAQQCVEKYVKALLVELACDFPKSHDIGELIELLPAASQVPLSPHAQEALSLYAVITRYPGNWEPLTREEAEEAVEMANQVKGVLRARLPAKLTPPSPE